MTFRHDPADIRAWATAHDIAVADAPEPEPGDEQAEPEPEDEPARAPRFEEYQKPGQVRAEARAERDRKEREAATLTRRLNRLRAEAGEYQVLVADRKREAGSLAQRIASLRTEAQALRAKNDWARAHRARQVAQEARAAAEDMKAAALARRVVQILEEDRELDPFTAALAALAQRKRRDAESAGDDEPWLAALAEAVQGAAERKARVRQLQIRQISANKSHGPDSPEADAVRRELAAERLAMVVLATLGTGLSPDDVISVALTGVLPDTPHGPPRLLTQAGWPVQP
jgi:hypothetical protein